MSLPTRVDVIVIGSGITGVASAAAIASRGASVVLLDKEDGAAREASGRAQGSLRIQGRHSSEVPLAQESVQLWTEAAAQDDDFELVAGGNLYIQTSHDELPVLQKLVKEAHDAGLTDIELLNTRETRELMPCATGSFLGSMWSPSDKQCQPEKGTKHYAARAQRVGVQTEYGIKVTRVLQSIGRVSGVDTTAGRIHANAVIIAAGIWTPYLARTVGLNVPIMPVAMSELETRPMTPLFEQTLRAFGFGARQRPNGRVVLSAGLNAKVRHGVSLSDFRDLRYWLPRAVSFSKSIKLSLDMRRIGEQIRHCSTRDTALIPQNSPEPVADKPLVHSSLYRIAHVIPGLAEAKIARYWAGMVDMTPDGLPVIDGHAGPENLVIITGLCGHGFTLGPVLGEIASELALDGHTSRSINDFRLSRFAEGPVAKPEMTI